MSIANLLDPGAINENWISLYANSLNVEDLTFKRMHIKGNNPIITNVSYNDSLIAPQLGVNYIQDAIDSLKSRSIKLWHFGGNTTSASGPIRLTYNGTSVSYPPLNDSYEVMSRTISYYKGSILSLIYDSTSGDETTEIEILINNFIVTTLALSGSSGIKNINVPISQGDFISIRWNFTGTPPGEINMDLLFLYA